MSDRADPYLDCSKPSILLLVDRSTLGVFFAASRVAREATIAGKERRRGREGTGNFEHDCRNCREKSGPNTWRETPLIGASRSS